MTPLDRTALSAQLAQIRARADAATPGPWLTGIRYDGEWQPMKPPVGGVITPASAFHVVSAPDWHYPDAEFIAAARTDVPALLAIIDRLTDALDVAENAIEGASHGPECMTWIRVGGVPTYCHANADNCNCWKSDYDAAKEALGHE